MNRTLATLARSTERDLVIPLLGSALGEAEFVHEALDSLRRCPETRAPREIIRHYDLLPEDARATLQEGSRGRLLVACHQLLRSDQTRTRSNIATFCEDVLAQSPASWADILPVLLVLIDDPRHTVRDRARRSFIDGLSALDAETFASAGDIRNPILNGVSVLLKRPEAQRDVELLTSIFRMGPSGQDLLGRAVGEEWDSAPVIEDLARTLNEPLDVIVDALFRWLRNPYRRTRECARTILRERIDAPFLGCIVRRLDRRTGTEPNNDPKRKDEDYPIYRHLRWELLTVEQLATLSDATLLRIVAFIQASGASAEVRAERLAHLLTTQSLAVQREVLTLLREVPTAVIVDRIAPLLNAEDPEIQRLATDLISSDGSPQIFQILVRQLASEHEEVRVAAQRKLSGQSLEIFFDAFESLGPKTRRQLLPILEKVDLHFVGQLRRALRSGEERDTVLALRTVLESHRASELEDSLLDLTVSPNPKVRATLSRTFAHVTEEAGLHYLRLFLSDPDPRVVANTIETISEVGDPRAVPWLRELGHHEHPRVRVNAFVALDRFGDPEAKRELNRLADQAVSAEMSKSARWGLAHLNSSTPKEGA
ncbi:MAG: HEAT repeat domain-containing protein [Planctomycetota bacterium]